MPLSLDSYLGVHPDALKVYSKRTEVLADNLANADTPKYQARDLDFRAALAAAGSPNGSLAMTATSGAHLTANGTTVAAAAASGDATANTPLKYRVPLAPSLDGNTVDVQMEQANFAENSVRYQAALTFLSDKFKGLMTAITGQ